jgi:Na+-translocating ferredoxin:NAD+ oxidoreductase RnfD subunit
MPKSLCFDPRHYQLLIQSSLLLVGLLVFSFPITYWQIFSVLATALTSQWLFSHLFKLPFVSLSALNTSLSILLLLHAETSSWLALVALISIASKFLITYQKQHIFNPSNVGIVAGLFLSDQVWAAPGQWGHNLWWFLLIAGLGLVAWLGWRLLLTSISFLVVYSSLIFLKAWWLGDPWAIPWHQLQNGSLLLFSFFMLSDPKTTPSHPIGRVLFGSLVALLAAYLQFKLYIPNAFLYALVCLSPLVLLINHYWMFPNFTWSGIYFKQPKELL